MTSDPLSEKRSALPMTGTVLVTGSRDWDDPDQIELALDLIRHDGYAQTVIHGGARGADSMADEIARRLGYTVLRYPADWAGLGKRAGIVRNLAMLDEKPDIVLAFQRNGSRGTQHTIDEANRRGIPVVEYTR